MSYFMTLWHIHIILYGLWQIGQMSTFPGEEEEYNENKHGLQSSDELKMEDPDVNK